MSDYVYESGMSTHRRKQRRTAITLLLTLLLLFGAFWWAWSYIRVGDDATPGAGETTTPTAGPTDGSCVDPMQVTINVYNSTTVSGLAARASEQLKTAGFTVGRVANDPEGLGAEAPVTLRFGPEAEAHAAVFRDHYLPEVLLDTPRAREGTELDVVLGAGFEAFDAFPEEPACADEPGDADEPEDADVDEAAGD